jgi:hypothetical protein
LTNWADLFIIQWSILYAKISFLEEKLHVAYNLRFLVVIKLAGKGAHKMRLKILNAPCSSRENMKR